MFLKKIAISTMLLIHNGLYLQLLSVLISASVEDPKDPGEGTTFLIMFFLPILVLNILVNICLLYGFKKRTAIVTGFMVGTIQIVYFVFLVSLMNII